MSQNIIDMVPDRKTPRALEHITGPGNAGNILVSVNLHDYWLGAGLYPSDADFYI